MSIENNKSIKLSYKQSGKYISHGAIFKLSIVRTNLKKLKH